MSILLKLKNKFIYYKPNYFYYKNQKKWTKFYKSKICKSFLNINMRRNYNSFYNLTFNKFIFRSLYSLNLNEYIYILNFYDMKNVNIKLLFSPFVFIKYNFAGYICILYLLIYFLFILCIFIFYKDFYNLLFFSKKIDKNIKFINTENVTSSFFMQNTIQILKSPKKDSNFFIKFLLNSYMKQKYLKNYLNNYYSIFIKRFDKNFNNSIILKTFHVFLMNSTLYINLKNRLGINNNTLLDISNNYLFTNFIYIYINKLKNNKELFNILNINTLPYKQENKTYYLFSNNFVYSSNMFYFFIFYWLFLIPLFFFEYILFRYYLKGHVTKKRKFIVFLKIFFDNFKIYIKLIKLFNDQVFYNKFKIKYAKNNINEYTFSKKKPLKRVYFFKWHRLNSLYLRMSPMGSYYYWYSRINKWHYWLCYYKYFFNSIYSSYYIKYFNFFFIFLCFIVYKYYFNNINKKQFKYTFFNFNKIKKIFNIVKFR